MTAATTGQPADPPTGRIPPPTVRLGAAAVPPELLGGKGAALAELVRAGYPVPETGVVTAAAYREAAAHPAIRALADRASRIDAGPGDEVAVPVDEVDAVFATVPIEDGLRRSIGELVGAVGAGAPVAVRSSATVEDLHGSSFAGQYRSMLDVDSADADAAVAAVRRVWASLWHPAPTAYRRAFGIDDADAAMAVVVMRMIPATSAGVVFTVDPGSSGCARVEAVEGLGEQLVSGQTTPSAWVVSRPARPAGDDGTGDRVHGGANAGPDDCPDDAVLPPVPAQALELAMDIERRFGVPQDVEWAAVDDAVHVVQARPITVLEEHDGFDTRPDDHELTTAGIVEMVPGVLPALRWEINRFLLEEAFRSVLDTLGILRGAAAEDRPFVRRVRGRVAIDFDQLRAAAAGIPGAVAELEQQYFGRPDPTGAAGPELGSTGGHLRRWITGLRRWITGLRRDVRTLRTRRQVIEQAEVLIRTTAALRRRRPALDRWDDARLLAYERRLIDLGARGLAAELGVAAAGAAAYRRLELQLAAHLGRDEGPRAAQAVTAGSGVVLDRRSAASAAIFAGPTWSERGAVPPASPGDPDHGTDHDAQGRDAQARWSELRDRLRALPGWTRRRILTGGVIDVRMRLTRRLVTDVTEQLQRRESAKGAFLELGGEVRRVHLELGRRLVGTGALDAPADIELLSSREIQELLGGGGTGIVSPDTVRRRRNWLSRYEAEGGLPIRFAGPPDRRPEPLPEGDVLHGWAASPGRRRGVARVVRSASGPVERGRSWWPRPPTPRGRRCS